MTILDPEVISSLPCGSAGSKLREEQERLYERIVARDELALLDSFDRTSGLVFCVALLLTGETSTASYWTEALFVEFWRAPETFAPVHGPLGLQMIRRLAQLVGSDDSGETSSAEPTGADSPAQ